MRVFFEHSGSLGTTYAINHIHYTQRKLNVHIIIDTVWAEIGRYVAYDSITIDKAVFIVTNLEKHTSYRDEIKSSVELKENSNFVADFKPDRNWTAKLYLPEEIESHNFWFIQLL